VNSICSKDGLKILDNKNWVVVGRFGRPHGIKGLVTVHSFTEPRENILNYADWHACINHVWQPINVLHIETHHKALLAQVDGYPSREDVAALTHVDIAVQESELEVLEPGVFYWYQLIGMNVVNTKGEPFGIVTEVLATGSNDVLVVQGDKKHLIPYLLELYIKNIDSVKRIIIADWDMDF
jgi:16S rRNA processing protein RimM